MAPPVPAPPRSPAHRRLPRLAALLLTAALVAAQEGDLAPVPETPAGDGDGDTAAAPAAAAVPAADLHGAAWTPVAGIAEVQHLFPSPVDPAVCYAAVGPGASGSALWVSHDRGEHWRPLAATGTAAGALPGPVTALLVDPLAPRRLYAGTAQDGVLRSEDGGVHWRACGTGLAHPRIHALVFAPDDPTCATIYASHSLAEPGLSVTRDGGASWRTIALTYAIGDLAVLDDCLFCAASSPAQGTGFFRADATKGWFCVLPEPPLALAVSPRDPHRLVFATREGGLSVSANAGISTRRIGPPGIDVEALAIDPAGAGGVGPDAETVIAYAPRATGVIASGDGGEHWAGWTAGLPPSEWVAEGAQLVLACDGAVAYATANGQLLRLERIPAAERLAVTAVPMLLQAGAGPWVITAQAPAGASVVADASALGGPAQLALLPVSDDAPAGAADGAPGGAGTGADRLVRYRARLDRIVGAADHGAPLRIVGVRASDHGHERRGRVAIRILPAAQDVPLWDATHRDYGAAHLHGAIVGQVGRVARTQEPYAHLDVEGAGSVTLPLWTGATDTVAVQDHALIAFGVRAATPGPLALTLVAHDNGQGSGIENSQPSHVLDLRRYLPAGVDPQVRTVCVPVRDLLEGSTCSPALVDLTFASGPGAHQAYDLLPIALLAQPGPQVLDAVAVPASPGRLRLRVTARGAVAAPTRAEARLGEADLPLAPLGTRAAALPPAPVRGWTGWLAHRTACEATFEGTLPDDLPPGDHQVAVTLHGTQGETRFSLGFTQPAAVLGVPALRPALTAEVAEAEREGTLARLVPDGLARTTPLLLAGGGSAVHLALAWQEDGLLVAIQAPEPAALTWPGVLPSAGPAPAAPQPHLTLSVDLPGQGAHTLVVAWTAHAPAAWGDGRPLRLHAANGAEAGGGWLCWGLPVRPDQQVGPGARGLGFGFRATLTTGAGHASWPAGDGSPAAGWAVLAEPTGPLVLTVLPTAGPEAVLAIASDRPLDDRAGDPAAWSIPGGVQAVVLGADRRRAWLIPQAWPLPAGTIAAPGVVGQDGARPTGSLPWPMPPQGPHAWGGG